MRNMSIVDEILESYNERMPSCRPKGNKQEEPLIEKKELKYRLMNQKLGTIAKELGCSVKEVQEYRKMYGLENVSFKSKLSKEAVEEIRKIYTPGDKQFGSRALARRFGISKTHILNIVR